jgi:hypothetical protein
MADSETSANRESSELAIALRQQLRYGLNPGDLLGSNLLRFAPHKSGSSPAAQASAIHQMLLASIERLPRESHRAVELLFGLTPETRHEKLTQRRQLAADSLGVTPVTFRRRREPQLLEHVARETQLQTVTSPTENDRWRAPFRVFISMPRTNLGAKVRDTVESACHDATDTFPNLSWSTGADLVASGGITASIMNAIETADLVIADATDSTPNVMFELGFAVANHRGLIVLNQRPDHLPLDVAGWRQLVYSPDDLSTLRELLANQVRGAIRLHLPYTPSHFSL